MESRTPTKKRRHSSPLPSIDRYSAKRRRLSGITPEAPNSFRQDNPSAKSRAVGCSDRFISLRPEVSIPLFISPRTERYTQFFGLKGRNVLSFEKKSSGEHENAPFRSLSSHAEAISVGTLAIPVTSAFANLVNTRQAVLALDGSGISQDIFAHPLTWSYKNVLAVACEIDLYYQDLTTRAVSRLGSLSGPYGDYRAVEWADRHEENTLAAGTTSGLVELWKLGGKDPVRRWSTDNSTGSVGGMAWNGHVVAIGTRDGSVTLYDTRTPGPAGIVHAHKTKVHGVKWSMDWNYLATSDDSGEVCIWDYRKGRGLFAGKSLGRMKHDGPVKAIAWCPWDADILTTGSMYPEGAIKTWSIKSVAASIVPNSAPKRTINLDTSVTSVHWSSHCKELLSTHGRSWRPSDRPSTGTRPPKPIPVISPLSNSLTVFRFPSYGRLVSVKSHGNPIGTSVVSPDGTSVFTVCPKEENMKLWKVWSAAPKKEKEKTMYSQSMIR